MKPDWTSEDGRIQLYCADCLDVLPHLSGVDAVITDPPYGIDYSSGHGSTLWGDGKILGDESTAARDAALELIGDSVPILCFGTWKEARPAKTRMVLVWDTLGALGMGDLRLPWKPAHQEIYVLGNPLGFSGERTSDVISCPPVQSMAANGRVHPFEKPIPLLQRLMGKVKGATVLDPFMGSGTAGVACIRTGRRFIGIEKDPTHFATARDRIQRELQQQLLPL